MDPTIVFLAALGVAVLIMLGGIVLATFLNRGAAHREQAATLREQALIAALNTEREARAQIEKERQIERADAAKYREATNKRMESLESEVASLKSKLAINEARYEIERATLMSLLRAQSRPSDAGYMPDTPQSEDAAMRDWIAAHFRMDGDIDQLVEDAQMPPPPAGSVPARAQWMVTWARTNGMSGNLAAAAKKARPRIAPWKSEAT